MFISSWSTSRVLRRRFDYMLRNKGMVIFIFWFHLIYVFDYVCSVAELNLCHLLKLIAVLFTEEIRDYKVRGFIIWVNLHCMTVEIFAPCIFKIELFLDLGGFSTNYGFFLAPLLLFQFHYYDSLSIILWDRAVKKNPKKSKFDQRRALSMRDS